MTYALIASTDNPSLRRFYAALGLAWLPFAALLAILWHLLGNLVGLLLTLVQDAIDLCIHEVPPAFEDMIFTLHTGQLGEIAHA